jgi:hypothetical protein
MIKEIKNINIAEQFDLTCTKVFFKNMPFIDKYILYESANLYKEINLILSITDLFLA